MTAKHHSFVVIQLWLEKATQFAADDMSLLEGFALDYDFPGTHDGD